MVALVITIVLLLILAGISIGTGGNIIKKNRTRKPKNRNVINRSKRKRIC